jgi:hypothetical protein
MTKAQELLAWEAFYHSLPSDSYSKGALPSLLLELECALRSDFLPTLSLADANAAAVKVLLEAQEASKRLLVAATGQSDAMLKEANKKAERMAEQMEAWKASAIRQIEKI